ncbi:MAG: 30S ribosomal protein S18, partial [Chloroflexi bacterium]|nr:30S ribosomal protein S18 [Chloroflexota bacterium]
MASETPPQPPAQGPRPAGPPGPPADRPRYGGPRPGGSGGGRGGDRDDRGGDRPRYGGPRRPRRKVCSFCVDKVKKIDFKDIGRIRRYVSERGKIDPRRKSGNCAKHQRMLTTALKRARHMAMLPYTADHVRAQMSPQARAMAGGPPPPRAERPPFRPMGAPYGAPRPFTPPAGGVPQAGTPQGVPPQG